MDKTNRHAWPPHASAHPLLPNSRPRRRVLTHAIGHAFWAMALVTQPALGQEVKATADTQHSPRVFNIPQGSLTTVLNRFGLEAGVMLSFSTDLTKFFHSQGLSGSYTTSGALRILLANTELDAILQGNGGYLLVKRAEPHPAASPTAMATLSTVVVKVNARKREEDNQDVPLSVSMIAAENLNPSAGNDYASIARSTPSVHFTDVGLPGGNFTSIRGVGGLGTWGPFDSQVAYSLDEVPTTAVNFDTLLLDADRVEVLRGPQGTLFGRSAQAGAINVYSRPADGKKEMHVGASVGSNGTRNTEAVLGGAIVNGILNGRLAVMSKGYKGDIPQAFISDKAGAASATALRGVLRWSPGKDTDLNFAANLNREARTPAGNALLRDAPYSYPLAGGDKPDQANRDTDRLAVTLRHDFGPTVLTAIAGWQQDTLHTDRDVEDGLYLPLLFGLPSAFFNDPVQGKWKETAHSQTLSHELRLSAGKGSPFEWVVGVSNFDLRHDSDISSRSLVNAPINNDQRNQNSSRTVSVFGDASVPLSETLTASIGLRQSHDSVSYHNRTNVLGATPFAVNDQQELTDNSITGRASLGWQLKDSTNIYLSYARGHSPGGFPGTALNAWLRQANKPFRRSTSDSFEVGVKHVANDGSHWVNASIFHNHVKDGQVYALDPSAFFVRRAENLDYTTQGFELEGRAALPQGWELFGGVAHTQADLQNAGTGTLSGARNGNLVPSVPPWSGQLGLEYKTAVTLFGEAGQLQLRGDLQHVGERQVDPANSMTLDAYQMINIRLGWQGSHWGVHLFANNLLDTRAQVYGANASPAAAPMPLVVLDRRRVVGLSVERRF